MIYCYNKDKNTHSIVDRHAFIHRSEEKSRAFRPQAPSGGGEQSCIWLKVAYFMSTNHPLKIDPNMLTDLVNINSLMPGVDSASLQPNLNTLLRDAFNLNQYNQPVMSSTRKIKLPETKY